MLNVRMMLGYRLLKSNTQTFSCSPVTGSSTWPPCCAACTRESSERTVGATILSRSSSDKIEKVERRDARRDAIRRHARERAARERERHEVQLRDDLIREPRVGARVERERRQIVRVVVLDLRDPIAHVAGDRLAFAEHLARDGIERVVVHAHERAAQQIDAVEHEPSRNVAWPLPK